MDAPNETNVWIGLDIGKADHFADVLDDEGSPLFAGGVANDEAAIAALLDRAASLGSPALVVDQAGSLAKLVITVAGSPRRAGGVRARAGDAPRRRPLPG